MTDRPSVLLITSNGWGMGHLIRQLTIKAHMPADVRCTILTLSQAAAVAAQPDLEYAPSYTQPWITKAQWHGGYLSDRIVALAEEVHATVIVFDGVVPYVGLLDALRRLSVTRIWLRRGLWRSAADPTPLEHSNWFDLIIQPADLGDSRDNGATAYRSDATRVGVITDATPAAALSRAEAAQQLGLDPERPTLLLNIGSSTIRNAAALDRVLASHPDWQICSTKDELARSHELTGTAIHPIRGAFPLWKYLACIDLAVTSVGYNAAHEFVRMGIPAVYVPSPTVTDDQDARATAIADLGVGWTPSNTSGSLDRLLEQVLTRPEMVTSARHACELLVAGWSNGAADAAKLILSATPAAHREYAWQRIQLSLRVSLENLLGNAARRKRRKRHPRILFSEYLTRDAISSTAPFEHILEGSSDHYRKRREAIARRWLS